MRAFIRPQSICDYNQERVDEFIDVFNDEIRKITWVKADDTKITLNTSLDNIPVLTSSDWIQAVDQASENGYYLTYTLDEHDSTTYELSLKKY